MSRRTRASAGHRCSRKEWRWNERRRRRAASPGTARAALHRRCDPDRRRDRSDHPRPRLISTSLLRYDQPTFARFPRFSRARSRLSTGWPMANRLRRKAAEDAQQPLARCHRTGGFRVETHVFEGLANGRHRGWPPFAFNGEIDRNQPTPDLRRKERDLKTCHWPTSHYGGRRALRNRQFG